MADGPDVELTPVERRRLEASLQIQETPAEQIAYQHSVLCQTALPTRRVSGREWVRRQGRVVLMVEAGKAYHPEIGEFIDLPLPFGPKARLVLLHLNSEAIKHGSPVIEAEDSMTSFIRRLMQGSDPNGREIRRFKEQLGSLSASMVRLAVAYSTSAVQVDCKVIEVFDLWFPKDHRQRVLWPSFVHLSPLYFESLTRFAVPLDERAIASLSHSAMALDIYAWLAQRLHRLHPGKPQLVSWSAMHEQFGQGYAQIRQFRAFFLRVLRQVQSVYPAARIDLEPSGLALRHSPPPVAKRMVVLPPSAHQRALAGSA
jgi:hypothetical protein